MSNPITSLMSPSVSFNYLLNCKVFCLGLSGLFLHSLKEPAFLISFLQPDPCPWGLRW